jgi:hypothetical protein
VDNIRSTQSDEKKRPCIQFLKKYSDSQCCWKKYSDFAGGNKEKSDSEFLSYNLMLNSGKQISRFAQQQK